MQLVSTPADHRPNRNLRATREGINISWFRHAAQPYRAACRNHETNGRPNPRRAS